jgi:Predicted AAA-ATPase/PD-(D/E)XK nuclease superfamily
MSNFAKKYSVMIKIPYGQSDFKPLLEEDYFYQDRTEFIEKLESWHSKYPVFLRPRRFGKSLFISTLHHYYGLEYKESFESIFGNLYIGKNPTPIANSFMVLCFDFSGIDTATHKSTYQGFMNKVLYGTSVFLSAYKTFFTDEQHRNIENAQSPEEYILTLFRFIKQNQITHKIYLMIDEYDHFANELLSFDLKRFKKDVSRNGFVHKFYENLKTAVGQGVIGRVFITGVSPVMLDSLTSGFNIADNISLNPIFHDMMGFTHSEVEAMLHLIEIPEEKIPDTMTRMAEWYDGYLFSLDGKNALFNPIMVLYFLKEYNINRRYPDVMLDINVASDYRKIRNIFKIGGNENARFALLQELIDTGSIEFPLTRAYNLEWEFNENDFLSLLFYMGMLSYKEFSEIGGRFEIPNYVIKKLYFEYFIAIIFDKNRFVALQKPIAEAIKLFLRVGNPEPFFKFVEDVLQENHSNRDEMVYGEKHLQTLMIGLLYPYESYYIHSEYEARRGYPDIFLERVPDRPTKFDIVLELKYVKKSAEDTLPKVIKEARKQLNRYMRSTRFKRPDVRGYYVVFLGGKLYEWREFGKY